MLPKNIGGGGINGRIGGHVLSECCDFTTCSSSAEFTQVLEMLKKLSKGDGDDEEDEEVQPSQHS